MNVNHGILNLEDKIPVEEVMIKQHIYKEKIIIKNLRSYSYRFLFRFNYNKNKDI